MFLVSCSPDRESATLYKGNDGRDGKDGTSCSVSEALDESQTLVIGALLSCSDGSSQIVLNGANGQNGAAGAQGIQGIAGNSCSISRDAGDDKVKVTCGDSSVFVYDGVDGQDGDKGDKGDAGPAGIDANGCTLQAIANNGGQGNTFRITCGTVSATFTDSTNPSNR